MGHVVMENRNGLVVEASVTHATGTAEREAATASRWAPTRLTTLPTWWPRCAASA